MRRKLSPVALLPFSVVSTLNPFFGAGKLQSGSPVGGSRSTPGGRTGSHHGCQLSLQGARSRQRVSETKEAPIGPLSSIQRSKRSGI